MADEPTVRLYLDKAVIRINEATAELLARLAFQLEGRTKLNIRENGQIDTGFMLNSTYTILPDGTYQDGKSGTPPEASPDGTRQRAPIPGLGDAGAGVAVGAEYAIYQEVINSFLYRAAEQVASQAGGTIEAVFAKLEDD